MKTIFKKAKLTLSLLVLLSIVVSCNKGKNGNIIDTDHIGIKLTLTEGQFSGDQVAVAKASTKAIETKPLVLMEEVQSGPFKITAELTENTLSRNGVKATTSSTKAATSLLSLRGAVTYRVVAYQTDGTYIDQAVGNAADPTQVFFGDKLIADNKYTFVIYSLGSTTTAPPAVPTTNLYTAGQLNFNFASYAENGADFMYAIQKDITILGNNTPTALTAPLQHMFTRVTILVDDNDATGTFGTSNYIKGGYLSEVPVQANWGSTFTDATIDLSTGATVAAATNNSVPPISNLNATGQTFIVNQAQNASFSISLAIPAGQIKVGHDVNAQIANFNFSNNGQGMKPGYSYTLKLRFNSDRYVNANNETRTATAADALYAVIGGYRWDRYNLGASTLNPSTGNLSNASTQALHGNFYQWGQQSVVANASTSGDGPIAGWNNNVYLPGNSWNSGTEALPVKVAANDPCSAGTRIPTTAEFQRLSSQTNWVTQGTWGDATTLANLPGYDATMIVTSKKSFDINLLFPAAGRRELNSGQLSLRGREGYYATSMESNTDASLNNFFLIRSIPTVSISAVNKPVGINVRCIQDK